jgi:oligoendopeptidase F
MLKCQKATYGEGLDERFLHKFMWAWKVHYYIPSLGLYSIYRERGQSFVKDYESLLSSTGEAKPVELASRFDIDLHKPDFWRSSLKVVEESIDRYVQL